ncbi:hypothetical protein [Micromonospora sicca]|nr:hypothetical protein [Micromonospora sp. 4G51]
METPGGGEEDPSPVVGGEPPGVVVFEVSTARRVGLQLRYGGGPWLDEIRVAVLTLTMQQRLGGRPAGHPPSR